MQEILLNTQNLTRYFCKNKVLDQVNLTLYRGDIYGLLGGNGAGKTTLFKMIVGLLWPHEGTLHLFGENIHPLKRSGLSRVGSVIGEPSFCNFISARENLEMIGALRKNHRKNSPLTHLSPSPVRQLFGGKGEDQGEGAHLNQILEIVGLGKRANEKIENYSDGMKQRLAIAQALIGSTELLILDEPFRGLDPVGIQDIWKILTHLNKTRHMTLLFSSHMVHIAQDHCNRIGILHKGKLIEQGDKSSLLDSHSSLEDAYLERVGGTSSIDL